MQKTNATLIFFAVAALILASACGGGGGGGGNAAPHTRAVVKLATSGTSANIGIVQVRLNLPSGVTVKATNGETESGVVTGIGTTAGADTEYGVYSAPSVTVVIAKAVGFSAGEFATVNCDIAVGSDPKTADFTASNLDVRDLDGKPINGMTATLTVTFN